MNDATRSVNGDIKAFNIFDITQSLMSGRKTALVTVQSANRKGYVYFREGQIVSALDDALNKGEQAVMDIFSWTEGTFTIDFDVLPDNVNIELPTDHLLLEVARNLDEVRHDRGLDPDAETDGHEPEDVGSEMKGRVDEKLRTRLNSVFKQVAADAEPGRARYTANAFDSLLQALLELSGTVLFLRADHRPRVKTTTGFATLKDETIAADEIRGFLDGLLSENEARELREAKEVVTFFHSPTMGTFKVTVLNEHGNELVTFAPSGRPVPRLEATAGDFATRLRETETGLIVVGGPLGSGKGTLVSSILADHMVRRDAFAFQLSDRNRHALSLDSGFCVHRALPAPGALATAVRGALEQEPDILALVGAGNPDALGLALGAAGFDRLVLFALESHTPGDTIARLIRLSRTADGDSLAPLLADRLRLIIDCQPDDGAVDILEVDSEIAGLFQSEDTAELRRRRMVAALVG